MSALGAEVLDARVLDLFSGSGALGLEALSRGAESVVFVERSKGAIDVIRANIDLLGAGAQATVVHQDVFRFLGGQVSAFDLAMADPPYSGEAATRLVERWVEEPFARVLWLEHPWREPLPLPEGSRTRRYGDTALSTITAPDR